MVKLTQTICLSVFDHFVTQHKESFADVLQNTAAALQIFAIFTGKKLVLIPTDVFL